MAEKKEMLEERLTSLQEEYSKTKDNKKTNKHLRLIKAKIARVRKEIIVASKRVHQDGYFVKKTGDATAALIGFPSTGKSSLINALANTRSKTASYDFTTTSIIPGTLVFNDSHIQIFDTPGLIEDAHLGAGGGRSVIAAMKVADLLVFVIDINNLGHYDKLSSELASLNIYVNRKKPQIQINAQNSGGLHLEINESGLPNADVQEILSGFGIHNATVSIRDRVGEDELIAIISGRAYYMRAIMALNKVDTAHDYANVAAALSKKYGMEVIPVSATENMNIDALKRAIYQNMGIITVYLKPRMGEERLMPMVLRRPATVGDAAKKFHTEIVDELKCAYITGPSAKFPNQRVGAAHALSNGDVITFIKNK